MSFGVVDTHHAAGDLNRTNDGWVFLVTVLSLRFLLLSLPESVPAQGMLGLVQGQVLTEEQIFRSITAVLLLWACLKGAGSLVHFARLLPSFVSNTKRILRRTSLLRRQVGVALVGFCLLWIDGSWIALGFCVLLWQFTRDVKRYPGRYTSRLYDLLWETRACWLFQIVAASLTSPKGSMTYGEVAISGLVTAAALWCQHLPRLSLNFCFVDGKRTPQVCFEQLLWMSRLERLLMVALLAWQPTPQTIVSLGLFSGTRLLLASVLSACLKSEEWAGCLKSEPGPWKDPYRRVFPDLRSYEDHQPDEAPYVTPREGFRDSWNDRSYPLLEVPRSPDQGSEGSPEYRLAILLLVLSLATAYLPTVSFSDFTDQQTYKTRLVYQNGHPQLYQTALSPGEEALLESVDLPRTKVALLPEAGVLAIFLGFAVFIRSVRALSLVWLACLMGWFWFPTSVAGTALFAVILLSKRTGPKQLFTLLHSVSSSIWNALTTKPAAPMRDPEWRGVPGYPLDELELKLGRGVLALVDPGKDAPLLPALRKWRRDFLNNVGFSLNPVRLRDDIHLPSRTIEVRLKGVPLGNIVVEGEYVQLGSEAQVIRDLNDLLTGHLQEFITTSRAHQILNQSTIYHNDLVKQVRTKHSLRTVKKVLKEVVAEGHWLIARKLWLNALLRAEGSDEQVISQVLTTLSSSPKAEATRSR